MNSTVDISDQVPFVHFTEMLERMVSVSKKRGKTAPRNGTRLRKAIFSRFMEAYLRRTRNVYPVFRLFLPDLDTERMYYLKETSLASLIREVYEIPPLSFDGKRLSAWRSEGDGDFPSLVEHSVHSRTGVSSQWTLRQVNDFLDTLATRTTFPERRTHFAQVISKLAAREVKWLVQIILKKLRVGIGLETVLDTVHPQASLWYTVQTNLKTVCEDVQDPAFCLEDRLKVTLFTPFQPMLAARTVPEKLETYQQAPYWVETKYDGERLLVHFQKKKVRLFSRKGKEVTSFYRDLILDLFTALDQKGVLSEPLSRSETKVSEDPSVESCILDGELMVWNEALGHIEPFGGVRSLAALSSSGASQSSETKHFFYMILDLVYLSGESLLFTPLEERHRKLASILTPVPSRVEVISHEMCDTVDALLQRLQECPERKEEGLVVKHARSFYMPHMREPKAWIKWKPDYVTCISSDLDVVIVGGNYGEGHRGGTISGFLVAVRDEDGTYLTCGRVGNGFSDRERMFLHRDLEAGWTKEKPPSVIPGQIPPEVWIDPACSRVIQVNAAQVVPSEKYSAGGTFRFPRAERLRYDKDATEIMTLEAFQDLVETSHSLRGKKLSTNSTKKKKTSLGRKIWTPSTTPTDVSSLPQISDLFQGKIFSVCGSLRHPENRARWETQIHEHGGVVHAQMHPGVEVVVAETSSRALQNILREAEERQEILEKEKGVDYNRWTVVQLQEALRKRRWKVSGRKNLLVARCEEHRKHLRPLWVVKPAWLTESIEKNTWVPRTEENAWILV